MTEFDDAWDAAIQLRVIQSKPRLSKNDLARIRALEHRITPGNARPEIKGRILRAARVALIEGGPLKEHGGTQSHQDIIDAIKKAGAHTYLHKTSGKTCRLSDSAIRKHLDGWLPKGEPGRPKGKAKA